MKVFFKIGKKLLFASMLLSILTVQPSVYATVGGRPANPDPDNPRTQSIFIYTLNPGEQKKDQIFLSNPSDSEETVDLYPVDGVTTNTGAYTCKQKAESQTDTGSWIKLSKSQVTVPAKGSMTVDFSVSVPKQVDVGEHNGCIAIERSGDDTQTTGSIRIKTRQAVRVVVVIPGEIKREVSISNFGVVNGEKNRQYSIALKNVGNVSADTNVTVSLKDMFGKETYKNGGQYVVIANQKLELLFDDTTKPFFGGWFTAKATISYDKRAGVFGTADSTQLRTIESQPVTLFVWPSLWAFILLGSVLLFLIGLVLWRRGVKKSAVKGASGSLGKSHQQMWGAYTVKSGDTLQSLAEEYGVSTSKIATLNRLSNSATLEVRQKIYVPKSPK